MMRGLVFLVLLLPSVLAAADCPYKPCYCSSSTIYCDGATVSLTSLPPRDKSKDYPQEYINMERNDMTAIKDGDLPPGLLQIESWFTPFTTIGVHAFNESATTLKRVIIQNSNLTAIPQGLADLQSQFSYLELTWAQISDISALTKIGKGLHWLELTGNRISDHKALEAGIMQHIDSLEFVSLGFNNLNQSPNFTSHTLLYTLDLDNNHISTVPKGTLYGNYIYTVQIRNNQLTEIPPDLENSPSLKNLYLGGNKIKSIDSFIFGKKLVTLYLDNNEIEVLNSLNIANGNNLKWVQLFNNPLRVIAPDAFKATGQIRQLTLSNTQLTRLPLAIADLGPHLGSLYLNGVKNLTCTCDEAAVSAYYLKIGIFNVGGECNGVSVAYFLHEMAPQCPAPTKSG